MTNPMTPLRGVPGGPPVDVEAAKAASRKVIYFGLFMLGAMLTSYLPIPLRGLVLVFAVCAVVQGIRALQAIRKAHLGGLLPMFVTLGLVFTGLMGVLSLASFTLWPVELDYQRCMQDAITNSAADECDARRTSALDDMRNTIWPMGPGSSDTPTPTSTPEPSIAPSTASEAGSTPQTEPTVAPTLA